MAGPYTYQTRTSDTLSVQMLAGATTATLTSGAFGSPTRKMILTIDGNVSAKAADFECTVAGSAITGMTLLNGPDVDHEVGASVWCGLTDEGLEGLQDFTSTTANAAWTDWVPTYTASGSMTFTSVTTTVAKYKQIGKTVFFRLVASGTTGGTASTAVRFTLPSTAKDVNHVFVSTVNDGSSNNGSATLFSTTIVQIFRNDVANWSLNSGRIISVEGTYEVA